MKSRTRKTLALLGGATVATLMWPGPASGQTSLGGYSGVSQAQVVRVQIYEPVIPIPTSPQIDGSIAFTRSNTDTGPVSRGLASYLWPGDTVGDGFGQLVGSQQAKYPVQVNSRFPTASDSPPKNTAQLTDGNGMTTASNESGTTATVTGLGVAGPGTDLTGGLLAGLGQLGGQPPPKPATTTPLPVSKAFATLATVQNVKSESDVLLGASTVTTTAAASASAVRLLGGLITIDGIHITSKTVSDGKKATVSGQSTIGAVTIAGKTIGLDEQGLRIAGKTVKLPTLPKTASSLLADLGISISTTPTKRSVTGATGSFSAQGLVITIDTNPLKNALNVGSLTGPLSDLISKIPQLGGQLAPLLGLGPKIVFGLGDVSTSASASPAYTGGTTTGGSTGGTTTGGSTNTGGGGSSGTGGAGGGVTGGTGGGTTGGTAGGSTGGGGSGGGTTTAIQPTGFNLPALGTVPRLFVLGGLFAAAGLGWLLRTAGGFLLGGARDCAFGLSSGVPDLRKV